MLCSFKERLSDFTPYFSLVIAVAGSACFTTGYDLNWWGGIMGQAYFNAIFGEAEFVTVTGIPYKSLSSTQQSVGTVASTIGSFLGALLAGAVLPRIGFRLAFVKAAVWIMLGSLIQITCSVGGNRYWQMVAGKIVVCLGVGMNSVSILAYLSQCSPSRSRGTALTTVGFFVAVGALVSSFVVYGVSTKMSAIVWLLPIGLQFLNPLLAMLSYPWMPESPVWLIARGRETDARKVLIKLRSNLAEVEVEKELQEKIAAAQYSAKQTAPLSACFRGTNLTRTLTVFGLACFGAAQGLSFLLSYLVVLFKQLGLENVFLMLMIIYILVAGFTMLGFLYQDTLGRRLALICGSCIMAGCMMAFSSISVVSPDLQGAAGKACIALIMIWFIAYTSTWNATLNTVISELPSSVLQETTLALAQMCAAIVSFIIVFVSPYIQNPTDGNLGAKIGYIYGSMSTITVIFLYFFLPECKGRTMEQVDWLYEHKIPIRQMGSYSVPEIANDRSTPIEPKGGNASDDVFSEKNEIENIENVSPRALS
ncbi:hypothetical protein NliqN6_2735 [Naganishia liquefaciens]|uniref:Major facilitator superfamily (MFS) profile domain-containing protein n=1 Tax=Naganishia liquefaciens TaxID=104408 RepID=A0A8H3YEJ5_9TREE|nr:hypothetical protein NliqN6_2735 [Naganishia liquefaciens]